MLRDISSFTDPSPFTSPNALKNETYHVTPFLSWDKASSETQGQSVGSGEKTRQKFSSKGGRAPGYRPLPNHFQTVKLIGLKNALYYCAQSLNSISWVLFVCSYTTAIVSPYSFGSCTKEIHAVWERPVWYKPRPWIPKYYCLPEN